MDPTQRRGLKDAWTEESRGPPLDRKAPGNEKVTWECGGGERRGALPQKLSGVHCVSTSFLIATLLTHIGIH